MHTITLEVDALLNKFWSIGMAPSRNLGLL